MAIFHITRETRIPLVGCLYFGVIDRGTNLLQVRPSCICNLNCPFCSVDAGPDSRSRVTNYFVELEYLLDWIRQIAKFKGPGVECHIDSTGEPMLYHQIVELINALKEIDEVSVVSMQSNGTLLDTTKINALENAGLDRVNLSIMALNPVLAKQLAGVSWYDIEQIKDAAKKIAASQIDLLIAPVFLPGINDNEIPKLIEFSQEIGAGKIWPPIGIQKFEAHKLGRKPSGIKVQTWWKFYNRSIRAWEEQFSLKLMLRPQDFGIEKRPMLPLVFRKNEKTRVDIKGPGWIRGEQLGVAKDRVVSVLNCPVDAGLIRAKIVRLKHNIYVGMPY
ncbi:MAG: radical SAM protein [Methanotrichaceae archaeon]|nr:radical SAM protein [Methanotrichaceae archaeon]